MLILASQSASRKAMLEAAGVSITIHPAALDERAIEAGLAGTSGGGIALALAEAKALSVSHKFADQWVLGSDSLVEVGGRRFDKPASRADAAAHLAHFSDKTMELHSAAVLVRNGQSRWQHAECAQLKVRKLGPDFIETYLDREWPAVGACVGVFRIEGLGVQLFETIEGSHFTVLGMPLLPVLGALRQFGVTPA